MGVKQKVVVWVGVLLIVAMGAYPPWVRTGIAVKDLRLQEYTYAWIFRPPMPVNREMDEGLTLATAVSIDIPRLLVQWATVAFGALGVAWSLRQRR
jgi:hypothetical protein